MPRLWRLGARFVWGICVFTFAISAGACSFSYKLGSLFGKDEGEKRELTNSVAAGASKATVLSVSPGQPTEIDLVLARTAAAEALNRGGKDVSVPWENPQTGARGSITPLADSYTQDGQTCRDFLASYVRDGGETWLEGAGCRADRGRWEIRALRPWKRS
jgi:surface antigen